MKIISPSATLLHHTLDPEKVIERAGRVCWKSEDRIDATSHAAFIRMLKDKKHESVLEHAVASFLIVTDRGIGNEIVRHRIASHSQESTRYCGYNKGRFGSQITVVKPSDLEDGSVAFGAWWDACREAEQQYFRMLENGAPPQVARSVLPTCVKTEIVMTTNFRSWRNFLALRLAPSAHPDIRIVAGIIRDELVRIAPVVFEEWAPVACAVEATV